MNLGNELKPTEVKDEPKVSWEAEAGTLYTLVMTGMQLFELLVLISSTVVTN